MKLLSFLRIKKTLLLISFFLIVNNFVKAQALSGVKTIDPAGLGANNYVSFSSAIDSLNKYGVGTGGVTYNVAADATFAETKPLVLRATGTAANRIVFQKSGTGANPIINPVFGSIATGSSDVANGDVALKIVGSDFVTWDAINIIEPAGLSSVALTEYGIAIMQATQTNGCKNITIKNSKISLSRTTLRSWGIWSSGRYGETFVSNYATSTDGRNENIFISNNIIDNCYSGIYANGTIASTAPYSLFDNNILVKNNTISNYSGGSATSYAFYGVYIDSLQFSNNTISNGTGHTATLYGVYPASGTNSFVNIDSNNVNLVTSATTSSLNGIYSSMGSTGTTNTVNMRGNSVKLNSTTMTSGTVNGIYNNGAAYTQNISGNTVSGCSFGTSLVNYTGAMYMFYTSLNNANAGSTTTIENNTIRDITRLQTAAGSTGTFYGFYHIGEARTANIRNNKVLNMSLTNTISSSYMMALSGTALTRNINNNTIDSIYTGGGTMYGMYTTNGTTVNIYNNLIRGIASNKSTSTAGIVYGLYTAGGTTLNIYNNIVADLRAPFATSINAIHGISLQGGTTVNLSYNTVYLKGKGATDSGTTFGSSAMYYTAAVGSLISKNNIFYNTCTAGPAGVITAIKRNSVLSSNYNTNSNNNIYYVGASGNSKYLIYWDGTAGLTGKDSVLASYKARVASADGLSLSGVLTFVDTTAAPMNLHINGTAATLVESAAQAVTGITTDFDGDVRSVNTPDVGADEGTFTLGPDIQGPVISYTNLINTGYLTNRTISVNITDRTGINTTTGTSPRLYFRKREDINNTYNGNTSATTGWKYVESTNTTSPFSFTIDYSKLNATPIVGDTIQYFVVAQDLLPFALPSNFNINSGVLTTPTTVALTSANFPVIGTINQYKLLPTVPAVITVGSSGTYPNLTGVYGVFDFINGASITQNVTIKVLSHLDETGDIALNQALEEGAGVGTYKIKIVPASASEDSIKGTYAGGLIRLNQADRVTIDGSYAGSGNYLTFNNKSTTGSSAGIHVSDGNSTTNGCLDIVIKNCTFTGPVLPSNNTVNIAGLSVGGAGAITNGGNHHNMVIDSNNFKSLRYGMYIANTFGRVQENLKIRYNNIGSADAAIRYCGIYLGGANKALISDNKISNITYGATYNAATGIYISGSTSQGFVTNSKIQRNIISKLTGLVLYAGANGIIVNQNGGTALNDTISSNFITDLRNTAGYADVYPLYNTFGIATLYGSGYHIYNNSINLFGDYLNTSTATTGTYSAGYINYAAEQINFKNNLIVNKLFPKKASAQLISFSVGAWFYSNASTSGANSPYVASLDNNNYDISGNQVGYVTGMGGTSSLYRDLNSWQIATNKDNNSFTEAAMFVDSINLHINSGSKGTLLESHGQNIVGLNRDIDNDLRPGPVGSTKGGAKAYDIGADEFDGVYITDVIAPIITLDSISPAVNACAQQAHTFYLKIVDQNKIDTTKIMYYLNGVYKSSILMTSLGSNKFRVTVPKVAAGLQVKVIAYAKDSSGNQSSLLLTTYTDAKFNFTATTSSDTIALGNTVSLNAKMPNITITMSGTTVVSSTNYPSPYNTSRWGNKEQYLYTAAELTAKGFVAGKITELGLEVGSVTTTLTLTNYTISMGHTNNTDISGFVTSGMYTVYMNPSYTILPDQVNTHTFQTPFIWDGVSNIVIETCFNNSATNGLQTIYYTTTPNVSCVYTYANAATVCSSPTNVLTSSNRPNFIISQAMPATYSWTASANGGLSSTNIINPDAIPTGTAGLYSYILAATSGGCTWTDTVDVRVITAVRPSAGFRTDTNGFAGGISTTFNIINSATNFPNTWNYTVTPNTYIYVNNTSASSKAPNLQFTRAGVYSIKQKVQNAAGSDSLTRTNYITIALKYCDAAATSTYYYNYISAVRLNSLNVNSGRAALPAYNNYVDSTNIDIPKLYLNQIDSVKIKLTGGTSFTTNNATAAWIDFNQNGLFETSEKLGEQAILNVNNSVVLNFTVPFDAYLGKTRLRIRTDSYNTGGVKACGTSNYGEIEDYAIEIINKPIYTIPSNVPQTGLVAWYPFNGNAIDESGSGNSGDVQGSVLTVDRYNNSNSSYRFNVNQQIVIPTSGNKNTYPLTISLWYNVDSLNNGKTANLFSKYNPASWNGYGLILAEQSNLGYGKTIQPFYLRNNNDRLIGQYNEPIWQQSDVQISKWNHVVMSVDSLQGKLYVNGNLESTHNWTGTPGASSNSTLWKIGGFYDEWFKGSLDDIGIWNRVLTTNEIDNLFGGFNGIDSILAVVKMDTIKVTNKVEVLINTNNISQKSVGAYQFKFNYNVNKYRLDSVVKAGTRSNVGTLIQYVNAPGVISFAWTNSANLQGTLPLLKLNFTAIDSGKSVFAFSDVYFNTSRVSRMLKPTVVNKYLFGDIDLNNHVQAYDAALALQYSVGLNPIPLIDPLPWENWTIKIANVDSSSTVTANDASLILKYAVGLISQFPNRGVNFVAPKILVSIENNELVFKKNQGDLQGLNVSILNQIENLLPASFVYSTNAISANNYSLDTYKLGIAFKENPNEGDVILRIPIKNNLTDDLIIEIYENENRRILNLNKTTNVDNDIKVNPIIYPNPAKNILTIDGLNTTIETEVLIYDMQGKLLISKKLKEKGTIDISTFNNGVYTVKVGAIIKRFIKL